MKRPDWVILLAIWQFLTSFFAIILAVALVAFALSQSAWLNGIARAVLLFVLSFLLLLLLSYVALSVAAGIGMLMGKEWGRLTAIVHSAVSLIIIPIGTVIGILALVYLMRPETKQYFQSAGKPAAS